MASSRRKRGCVAILGESTNILGDAKRKCATRAGERIEKLSKKQATRGRHAADSVWKDEANSLHQALKSRPQILQKGHQILQTYVDGHTTFTTQKALALNIFIIAMKDGDGILQACTLASKFTGFNAEVIRRWAEVVFRDFLFTTANIDDVDDDALENELMSSKGKHPKWISLMHDENFQLKATEYVREHGYTKGVPNLTLADFILWVAEEWKVEICQETARCWLHKMGFSYRQFSKGIYFDGHERDDVVQDRKEYVAIMGLLEDRFLTQYPPPPSLLALQPIIRVFHDESTFHANADQSFHWSDGSNQALKQKSLGQAIMISDFIDEVNGYLKFGNEEARLYLEHQTDGYFTNELFMEQVNKAVGIFERKYPRMIGMFVFDNAPLTAKRLMMCSIQTR